MILPWRGPAAVVKPLILVSFFLLPLLASAQNLNLSGASNCTAADFDTNLQFVNGPGDYYTIVVSKHNISSHRCVFDGPVYGPTFVPDRVAGHEPFGLCYGCDSRTPNGQHTPATAPIVDPGQAVRQTFHWKTKQLSEAVPCLQPSWMSDPVLLVAPALLKKICSDVEVSLVTTASPSDSLPSDAEGDGRRAPQFKLASDKSIYDEGEGFSVRLSRVQMSSQGPLKEEPCPTLYLRQRSPDGATRIDEVRPLAFKGCTETVLGHQPGDWLSGFDLDSGATSKWQGAGEHQLEVFQLLGSPDDPQLEFGHSNILRIQLADPTALQRKWGRRVKGVAADITLDKDTFRLGEDVSLHLAIEDFDADAPIYSWDPVWDPCVVVGIKVQDSAGHPLPASELFPHSSICTGHGFGPRPLVKGKVIPMERSLRAEGLLPNHPGTFNIVITWAPCFGPKHNETGPPAKLKPYAVVQAASTLHIVGNPE